MSIWLDPRIGSGELLPYFKPYGVQVDVQQLSAADAMWWGNGHDGPVLIGAERKILTDLVSSMRTNRLSGSQLTGLLETYKWIYLIVEGIWGCGENGETVISLGRGNWVPLRIGSRAVMYEEIDHYIATLEHRVGVTVKYTANKEQTVAWLVSRYNWWNKKDWYEHDSFEAIYTPYEEGLGGRRGSFTRRVAGPVEIHAAQLPGVSKRAFQFSKLFPNVHRMVNAEEKEYVGIEGIGKTLAGRIYRYWRGL